MTEKILRELRDRLWRTGPMTLTTTALADMLDDILRREEEKDK